jgi:hypothetical protein
MKHGQEFRESDLVLTHSSRALKCRFPHGGGTVSGHTKVGKDLGLVSTGYLVN